MHKEREREPSGLQILKGAATFDLQLIGPIGYTYLFFQDEVQICHDFTDRAVHDL